MFHALLVVFALIAQIRVAIRITSITIKRIDTLHIANRMNNIDMVTSTMSCNTIMMATSSSFPPAYDECCNVDSV